MYILSDLRLLNLIGGDEETTTGTIVSETTLAHKYTGGAEEDRTPDLCIANAALSQLSYRPIICPDFTKNSRLTASLEQMQSGQTKIIGAMRKKILANV